LWPTKTFTFPLSTTVSTWNTDIFDTLGMETNQDLQIATSLACHAPQDFWIYSSWHRKWTPQDRVDIIRVEHLTCLPLPAARFLDWFFMTLQMDAARAARPCSSCFLSSEMIPEEFDCFSSSSSNNTLMISAIKASWSVSHFSKTCFKMVRTLLSSLSIYTVSLSFRSRCFNFWFNSFFSWANSFIFFIAAWGEYLANLGAGRDFAWLTFHLSLAL
jgi:hypothetical protein